MTLRDTSTSIRTLLARLELISHAPINAYGRQTPDSGEDIGGKRPPGSDREHRPRQPKAPRIEGDAQSEKRWDEFEEELAAWKACYHRRTVWYFRRRLDARDSRGLPRELSKGELGQIRLELEETLKAWRQTPIPEGQEPEYGSAQWKRWVAESDEPAESIAQRTWNPRTGKPVGKRYINKIRQQYRTRVMA